jgi:mRNA interferase MazF
VLQLPARGDVWHASFEPVQGREQGRDRPCLVISIDSLNQGPGDLVVVAPITTTPRNTPFHVPIEPPDGGLSQRSFVMCEQIRALSIERLLSGPLVKRYGRVSAAVMRGIEDRLRIVLNL